MQKLDLLFRAGLSQSKIVQDDFLAEGTIVVNVLQWLLARLLPGEAWVDERGAARHVQGRQQVNERQAYLFIASEPRTADGYKLYRFLLQVDPYLDDLGVVH